MQMFERAREYFATNAGRQIAIAAGVLGLLIVIWAVKRTFGETEAAAISADRMFIDAATGKPFEHVLKVGDRIPVKAPSGGNTGYQAELCYWTKDGKVKKNPTPVLMNGALGKPDPTFCPDCDRLVVGHNPMAEEGKRPPPTKEEYYRKRK